ncbi:MAG: hypothetical protein JKY56_03225, partial [Kofleriaceae bacterium]|nr:hypothetical protein [Kofleriaceae bacterium]
MLKDYFDRYLPNEPTPELASFVDVSVFRYFDDAMKASQGLRGSKKKEFLNISGECLAHVMVHCFDATASGVGLEATVLVRDANLSIGAWTRKCFANPVADSIQVKCAAFLGPDTGTVVGSRSDILRDSRKLAELCSALGCS